MRTQARIDFDEDLPPMDALGLGQCLAELREKVTSALDTAQRGRLLSTGLQVLFYVCASLNNHLDTDWRIFLPGYVSVHGTLAKT